MKNETAVISIMGDEKIICLLNEIFKPNGISFVEALKPEDKLILLLDASKEEDYQKKDIKKIYEVGIRPYIIVTNIKEAAQELSDVFLRPSFNFAEFSGEDLMEYVFDGMFFDENSKTFYSDYDLMNKLDSKQIISRLMTYINQE